MKHINKVLNSMWVLLAILVSLPAVAKDHKPARPATEWHVSPAGNDAADGSPSTPLRRIQTAAMKAQPGDVITVHAGVYRERVAPPRGGTSPKQPITYRAAEGERVEIKGSEEIKGWKQLDDRTWGVVLPNTFFGEFNPYSDTIHGDWLERGKWCHTGEVYLNNTALNETQVLDNVLLNRTNHPLWYVKTDKDSTWIWANFPGVDPNRESVEINVRQSVFYPERPFINYITVRGFHISQAATPWAPPTAEQIGAIGTHWSKGWVIEDNHVTHSKCVGITLGKYGDEWDNKAESEEGYNGTIRRALENGWDRATVGSHTVRRNEVSLCGQAGIAGSLGAIFSTIEDNVVHDIAVQNLFWGYEMAGIKFHAPIDVVIRHNHIYRTEGGIWLDWMAQGTRVTGNLLHDNRVQDFSLEVNHGPILVDNNLFLSPELAQVKLSQGVAFVHNTIVWKTWPTGKVDNRRTPYLVPHGTQIAGLHDCPCGDVTYLNNLFTREDLAAYKDASLPVRLEDNRMDSLTRYRVTEESDGWYLYTIPAISANAGKPCKPVHTSQLPDASIPAQAFTEKGKGFAFETDYTGRKRSKRGASAGAIEYGKVGGERIKVYPSTKNNDE